MQTLLIANRGEIALRIMRTASALGIKTLAIYSDADRHAEHVKAADMAIGIGGFSSVESYLDIEKVMAAAVAGGADAVHPGYGFLAENPDLAHACAASNLIFVGPSADILHLMGNKRSAKDFAEKIGVPCIPGYQGSQDPVTLALEAAHIGYPLMLKAAAGGGGRGMRRVNRPEEFQDQLKSAQSEAQSAFVNREIILEKALTDARHIEIQVFADSHGNTVYFAERDCSVQRRHQKIIEETPSPIVNADLRQRMGESAAALCKACRYLGAGTVEFLLDADGNYYFLEMNTRLQVEHGITELIYQQDLVEWQLAVARGGPLPLQQSQLHYSGHTIEVRLCAEDPQKNFLPQSGKVLHWREPASVSSCITDRSAIRIDHALAKGQDIPPYYDPMLGKVMAWGKDRNQACGRIAAALQSMEYLGPINNQFFLQQLVKDPAFLRGEAHTGFLDNQFTKPETAGTPDFETLALAALLLHENQLDPTDRRCGRANWTTGNTLSRQYKLKIDDKVFNCQLTAGDQGMEIRSGDQVTTLTLINWAHARVTFKQSSPGKLDTVDHALAQFETPIEGDQVNTTFNEHAECDTLHLVHRNHQWKICDLTYAPVKAEQAVGDGIIRSPMESHLVAVTAIVGASVKFGDPLAIVEAMKMEHPVKANCDGIITEILAQPGSQLRNGQLILKISTKAPIARDGETPDNVNIIT